MEERRRALTCESPAMLPLQASPFHLFLTRTHPASRSHHPRMANVWPCGDVPDGGVDKSTP